jgi:hypothetical protein
MEGSLSAKCLGIGNWATPLTNGAPFTNSPQMGLPPVGITATVVTFLTLLE